MRKLIGRTELGTADRASYSVVCGVQLLAAALVLALAGCASTKSIPTSSDARVSAAQVNAKGGTIACASGLHATLVDGEITALDCASNAAWTDPPTAEETTALSELGKGILGLLALPVSMLRAALTGIAGG